MAFVPFEVLENGAVVNFDNYSGKELESLQETLDKLTDKPGEWDATAKRWKEPYYTTNVSFPDEGTSGKVRFLNMMTSAPMNAPKDWIEKFAGKTLQITPRQLGLSAWPEKVEVRFGQPSKVRLQETV
jgi:hypothetical protein